VSAAATTVAAAAEPTATAVESATTATTAAVESAATCVTVIATCRAACEGVSATGVTGRTTVIASPGPGIANAAAISIPTAITYSAVTTATVAVSAASVAVSATAPISVIPRSGADKEAAYKPARSVVAIGRAGVRIIVVVSPGTNRSGIPVTIVSVAADSDTDSDLGVRRRSRHQR
jgi:hypothetical protein